MTFYYMPAELWRRVSFYAAVLGVALVIAPFECRIKFN